MTNPNLSAAMALPPQGAPEREIVLPEQWLFIQMSDEGTAFLTWCSSRAEIAKAVAAAVYVLPLELDEDETEQVKGITDSLIEDGFFDFEGDPGLKLFRVEGDGRAAILADRAAQPPTHAASPDVAKMVECDHAKHLVTGHEKGYYRAWCDACGLITHAADGYTVEMKERADFSDWCNRRVAAYGCSREVTSGQGGVYGTEKKGPCESWCGSTACSVSLRAATQASSAVGAEGEMPIAPECAPCAEQPNGRCCGTGECWTCPLNIKKVSP